jgi:hypothetical protein
LELSLTVLKPSLEFADTLANPTHQRGKLFATKKEQDNQSDENPLRTAR